VHRFDVHVALPRPWCRAKHVGEKGFGRGVAMQDIALSTFLVIQHELHGDARAARPARVGRIAAVTGEIARIFREIRWRHASSYTSSAMPCLAGGNETAGACKAHSVPAEVGCLRSVTLGTVCGFCTAPGFF